MKCSGGSRAHLAGVTAFILAASMLKLDAWRLPGGWLLLPAALPLAGFVVLCMTAPYFPRWSFFLPIVNAGFANLGAVALTFDDGPEPELTQALLDLLARHQIKATFFVVGKCAARYPALIARIRDDGHEIGNHSLSHDALLMLRSMPVLEAQITGCQQILADHGIRPLVFRPPAGITNPRLGPVLRKLNLGCVCFSCRPLDFGNLRIRGLAQRVLARARAGDILLLHDCKPSKEFKMEIWLAEIEKVIQGLRGKNLKMVLLSELTGCPVTAFTSAASSGQRVLLQSMEARA